MMLQYDLDRPEEAKMLEDAVESVVEQGIRTPDIKIEGDGCKLVGCVEMGEAVAKAITAMETVTN